MARSLLWDELYVTPVPLSPPTTTPSMDTRPAPVALIPNVERGVGSSECGGIRGIAVVVAAVAVAVAKMGGVGVPVGSLMTVVL
mmetsp:Transcript_33824/g.61076  ORF Transcript_33824/g.61076 Transcript_33824/m.61076 type:complete len:84 (-) Transcript_33824:158-409(-)